MFLWILWWKYLLLAYRSFPFSFIVLARIFKSPSLVFAATAIMAIRTYANSLMSNLWNFINFYVSNDSRQEKSLIINYVCSNLSNELNKFLIFLTFGKVIWYVTPWRTFGDCDSGTVTFILTRLARASLINSALSAFWESKSQFKLVLWEPQRPTSCVGNKLCFQLPPMA